ncbi:MAG: 4-hydroxy-3-methylbut-2-enyl diphosphate reductase [Muribaculaceae bacterium]|nr:4-hydroxy-3-methylbut-2-enyl diphosphate reductase [Muribaculaceae bacterium]
MRPTIEIDSDSGFCFGVVTAIRKAEEELHARGSLYCLGDIVHNTNEVERLKAKGLQTITHDELGRLQNVKVLLRAHGEPPATYRMAAEHGIDIIDATCPVVLQLQKRIKSAWEAARNADNPPLILIYGKPGHAEVNGLVGQTDGTAVVIQSTADLDSLNLDCDVLLYSQTTKSLTGFQQIIGEIKRRKTKGEFHYFDTICRRVAGRIPKIRDFAMAHQVVLFVSDPKSSNGKALCEECRAVNPNTYFITEPTEIDSAWLAGATSIGICGATSTPRWLMESVRDYISQLGD